MSIGRTLYLIPAVALSLACWDAPVQTPTNPRAAPNAPPSPSVAIQAGPVSYDDLLERIAQSEPAFAGLYFRNGALHVVLTNVSRDPVLVRRAITAVFSDPRLATLPIAVDQGLYGFSQLAAWRRLLPRVFSITGVVSTDIDEVNNKLSIGVTSDAAGAAVQALLTRLNVPSAAITIHPDVVYTALQSSGTSLGGEVRNIIGGVHIDVPGKGFCTLGLNVNYGGASFLTDGHCTQIWGASNDGTQFWQSSRSVSADLTGSEGTESRTFGPATDSRCSGQYQCKWSDATFVPYDAGMVNQQSMGYIARTTSRLPGDSNLVINSSNPTIPITNKTLFPFPGDVVDKVGARTGWTYGQVTATGVNRLVGNSATGQIMEMISQHEVAAGAGPGDSGSCVFVYDQNTGNASWAGQLIAGFIPPGAKWATSYIFAPLNNIQSEFGNVPATIYGQ